MCIFCAEYAESFLLFFHIRSVCFWFSSIFPSFANSFFLSLCFPILWEKKSRLFHPRLNFFVFCIFLDFCYLLFCHHYDQAVRGIRWRKNSTKGKKLNFVSPKEAFVFFYYYFSFAKATQFLSSHRPLGITWAILDTYLSI